MNESWQYYNLPSSQLLVGGNRVLSKVMEESSVYNNY